MIFINYFMQNYFFVKNYTWDIISFSVVLNQDEEPLQLRLVLDQLTVNLKEKQCLFE